MDPERLLRLQAQGVRSLIDHAWKHVPYYREWMRAAAASPGDVRDAGDLARLPTIQKIELTLHPEKFSAPSFQAKDGIILSSSGTSGDRRQLRYDAAAVVQ